LVGLRQRIKNSASLICAYYLINDWRAGRRLEGGEIDTDSGRRHASASLSDGLDYVDRVFSDYLRYGNVEKFHGNVCEIGPGDSFAVALRMLDSGAEHVVAVDRFYSRRDTAFQTQLYRALSERNDLSRFFDGEPSEATLRGVDYHSGEPAESYFARTKARFDFILSRAVLEHLYDPVGALDDMVKCLTPGGRIIHRIDLRDHGMFEQQNPLTFLTIPEIIYRRMVKNSGRPNRILLPAYRHWLERSAVGGGKGSIKITRLAGAKDEIEPSAWDDITPAARAAALDTVAAIRPRLIEKFRNWADEDLAVSGIVLELTS
jgi:SAM-dependent methyltransferase